MCPKISFKCSFVYLAIEQINIECIWMTWCGLFHYTMLHFALQWMCNPCIFWWQTLFLNYNRSVIEAMHKLLLMPDSEFGMCVFEPFWCSYNLLCVQHFTQNSREYVNNNTVATVNDAFGPQLCHNSCCSKQMAVLLGFDIFSLFSESLYLSNSCFSVHFICACEHNAHIILGFFFLLR